MTGATPSHEDAPSSPPPFSENPPLAPALKLVASLEHPHWRLREEKKGREGEGERDGNRNN